MRTPSASGWVLYDGECAFCIRWIHFWLPVLRRRGFEAETLQADWVPDALNLRRADVLKDIRLLTASGEQYAGADVYLHLAKKIWWAWPFGLLFSLPGFNQLMWAGYRSFAAHRLCVSGYCTRRT